MGPVEYNSERSNINVDTALASIISQFDDTMLLTTIQQHLYLKFRPYNNEPLPNVINAIEQNLKLALAAFSGIDSFQQIMEARNVIYKNCIDYISGFLNLRINISGIDDIYMITSFVYDFFISKFTFNIISFLSDFIVKERIGIVQSLNIVDNRKIKDSSTIYANKIFKDPYIATIHANVDKILNIISGYDITLNDIFNILLPREYQELAGNVQEIGSYFNETILPYISDPNSKIDLVTLIKLDIQRKYASKLEDIKR